MPPQETLLAAAKAHDVETVQKLINAKTPYDCQFPGTMDAAIRENRFLDACFLLAADAAITHFKLTGEILDELLPLYDQEGRWIQPRNVINYFGKVEEARLPEGRRTIAIGNEIHLRTSLKNVHERPKMRFKSVAGGIYLPHANSLEDMVLENITTHQLEHILQQQRARTDIISNDKLTPAATEEINRRRTAEILRPKAVEMEM